MVRVISHGCDLGVLEQHQDPPRIKGLNVIRKENLHKMYGILRLQLVSNQCADLRSI